MNSDIETLILAGGLGTRLRQSVADRPKPMALVAGKPFITYLLDNLARQKLRTVLLCVGHMASEVQQTLQEDYGPLRLIYSVEDAPLGTAGALRHALKLTRGTDLLVMNGDSYCDVDIATLVQKHRSCGGAATLVALEKSDRRQSGALTVDANGRVLEFQSRPKSDTGGLISAGVYMLRRTLLEAIASNKKISLEDDIFPAAAERGDLYAWPVKSRFIDIGTPESYRAAQMFFRSNIS